MKLHTWMSREGITMTSERSEATGGRSVGLYVRDTLLMTTVAADELGAIESTCRILNRLGHGARAALNNEVGLIFTRVLEPSSFEDLAPLVMP